VAASSTSFYNNDDDDDVQTSSDNRTFSRTSRSTTKAKLSLSSSKEINYQWFNVSIPSVDPKQSVKVR
jgi:hypothetical protein